MAATCGKIKQCLWINVYPNSFYNQDFFNIHEIMTALIPSNKDSHKVQHLLPKIWREDILKPQRLRGQSLAPYYFFAK